MLTVGAKIPVDNRRPLVANRARLHLASVVRGGILRGSRPRVNSERSQTKPSSALALGALVALLASTAFSGEIVRLGREFRVNTTTAGEQSMPSVAALADGSFVVLWASAEELGYCARAQQMGTTILCDTDDDCSSNDAFPHGSDFCDPIVGVLGQRLSSAGEMLGTEFRVDERAVEAHLRPDVVGMPSGGFVAVWKNGDGRSGSIRARLYDSSGTPRDAGFEVAAGWLLPARLAADGDGNFIVVWLQHFPGTSYELFGRRYSVLGEVVQGEFKIDALPPGLLEGQSAPAVAMNSTGEFIVAWMEESSYPSILARRFTAGGLPREPAVIVDRCVSSIDYKKPAVSFGAEGSFVVVWDAYYAFDPVERINRIRGQWYDDQAQPVGSRFLAGSEAGSSDRIGDVAAVSDESFIVAWSNGRQVGVRAHDIRRGPQTDPVGLVGASIAGYTSRTPDIAALGSNEFVVVWSQLDLDRSGFNIHAHRIRFEPGACCGCGDCDGNGVVTIDELVSAVNIALGELPLSECAVIDGDGDGRAEVQELVAAVAAALERALCREATEPAPGGPLSPVERPGDQR